MRTRLALACCAAILLAMACAGDGGSPRGGPTGGEPGQSTVVPVSTAQGGGSGGLAIAEASLSCVDGVPNVSILLEEPLAAEGALTVTALDSAGAPLGTPQEVSLPADASAATLALVPETAPPGTAAVRVAVSSGTEDDETLTLDASGAECLG